MPTRLLLAALAALLVATAAHAAPAAPAAPRGLHAFLFRTDEPTRREFARTPSFAWRPVRGALRYELELATSDTFRENGLVYVDRELKTPVASVTTTLPWITGSPYSLYARVRTVSRSGVSPWSAPFGFNLRQPLVPKPLESFPGLLRWTPIEGAMAYQVWLVDVDKTVVVYSNVLDERELYTFHRGAAWTSKVRWRVRTLRWDASEEGHERRNGLPASSYGPWSPVYESANPQATGGELRPVATVAESVVTGRDTDAAHRLMPGFVFSGTAGLDGKDAELFRVYVFTDRDCVNRVFASAVVGSPAYGPRPRATALPKTTAELALARGTYLRDAGDGDGGDAAESFGADGEPITANESLEAATPTTSLPAAATPAAPSTGGSAPATGGAVSFLTVTGELGAPVDLWDTAWPQGGYYWTVVPVDAIVVDPEPTAPPPTTTTTTPAPTQEASPNVIYRDRELPQEACAAGRVMRFGKSSEPVLVASGTPFASGLSPRGRLVAATSRSSRFYGAPLVAWAPALGADAYHVQWSRSRSPFRPATVNWRGKGAAAGFLTFATSAVLPLQPGTWWYRVRGLSFHLPANAQYMSWSDPARLTVTKPTFRVARKNKKR